MPYNAPGEVNAGHSLIRLGIPISLTKTKLNMSQMGCHDRGKVQRVWQKQRHLTLNSRCLL